MNGMEQNCVLRICADGSSIEISTHERMQVMAHTSSETFDRSYLSQHVRRDVQNLYQGQAEHTVLRTAAQMRIYMDPPAPFTLSKEQRAQVLSEDEKIHEYKRLRSSYLAQIKVEFGTVKNAYGSDLFDQYKRAKLDQQAESVALCQAKSDQFRAEYFANSHKQTLLQQLNGNTAWLDHSFQDNLTGREFFFPERAQVANAFFFAEPLSEQNYLVLRRETISSLVDLCHLREPNTTRKSQSSEKQEESRDDDVEMITDPGLFPLKISSTQCLFCIGDTFLTVGKRKKNFTRLQRHVNSVHLSRFDRHCPHPSCDNAYFEKLETFRNHAARVHGSKFSY